MKGEKQNMNKFLTKVAKIFLGLSMAAGVGVAVGAGRKDASPVHGAEVTYKLTIDGSRFNTTSYAANNNEKTTDAICTTDNTKKFEVKWTSYQVMKNGNNMQWQKSNGYIYNSTDLGTITDVTVTSSAGSFTTSYGTSEQPSSGSLGSGKGYFKTKVGGATGTTSKIEVVFKVEEGGGGGGDTPEPASNTIIIDASNYSSYTNSGCASQGVSGSNKFSDNNAIIMNANGGGYIYNSTAFETDIEEFYVFANGSTSTSAEIDVYFSATSSNPSTNNVHKALSTQNYVHTITVSSGARYFKVVSSNSSKKAQIQIKIVLAEAKEQAGIQVEWATGKGTYYNGAAAGSKIVSDDVKVSAIDENGDTIGASITNGVGFKLNIYEASTKLTTLDATSAKATTSAIFSGKDVSHTYTLTAEMANPEDANNPWVSDAISITLVENIIDQITSTSADVPSYEEYVAFVDDFTAWSGTFNTKVKDGGTRSNRATTVKYYNGSDQEVQIDTLLTGGKFNVTGDNLTLTCRVFDSDYVGKTGGNYYPNKNWNIYIYEIQTFSADDPNGEDAEYSVGSSVSLEPIITIEYLDKDVNAQEVENTSASMLNFYISDDDGETYTAYTGTMPLTPDIYKIKAELETNTSFFDEYYIAVVDKTLTVTTSKNTSYIFGESFSKSVLTVKLDDDTIAAANYTVLLDEVELTVIKFIGTKTLTIRHLGYEAELEVTSTNVGSSTSNIHDNIPGEMELSDTSIPVEYDSNSADGIVIDDGFQTTNIADNKTYNALFKNNTTIQKTNVSQSVIGQLVLTFNARLAKNDSSFVFTLSAMSGTTVLSDSDTYDYSGSTTDELVTLTIDLAANKEANGWKLSVTKSGTSNCQFYDLALSYKVYVQGEDQTFNATPREQALAYSAFFLENTSEYCAVTLTSQTKTLLATEYNGMVADAKTEFTSADIVRGKGVTYEDDISEALSRYVNMYEEKDTGDFLSLGSEVLNKSSMTSPLVNIIGENTNTVAIIVIISMVSVTAIGGYFFLRKRKENI